ncbi:MAG TPA: hypothetical protein VJ549_02635 [Geothrix sp.]|nr:hypothetical protein [Geothrix sp.]
MNRSSEILQKTVPVLGLVCFLACGGGGGASAPATPAPPTPTPPVTKTVADTLVYSNPTVGVYKLVRNESKSSAGHLVLDLIGPAGAVSGVGFYLTADQTKVAWSLVDAADSEKVKSSAFSDALIKSQVGGGTLQAGVYQKGITAPVNATTGTVLASVALDLKNNVPISNPPSVSLTAGKALMLNVPGEQPTTNGIVITVGTLSAN